MSTLTVRADQVKAGDYITHIASVGHGLGTVTRTRKHKGGWPYIVVHTDDGDAYDLDVFELVTVERPAVAA